MFFLTANFSGKLENKHEFYSFVFYGKITFLGRDKDCTLTYQRLIGIVMSFAYLEFLDTRLSLSPSLFPILLVLRYRVTSRSRFYQ
jgi:hypothetical protein